MTHTTDPADRSADRPADRRVLLDNGGRAPWHPLARQAFVQAMDDGWADPRRLHAEGRRAARLLDGAREAVAAELGARTEEVRFTPSHTAALHSAVLGGAGARRRSGGDVVVGAVERAAVLHAAESSARTHGGTRVVVAVDDHGRVDADGFRRAVGTPGVALAALQAANGEVGTRQPVVEAHEAARAAGVPLLVDAGASLGHDATPHAWDLLAADPADWGAPAGVGVLAVRQRVRLLPRGPEDPEPWAPGGVSVPAAFAAAVALQAVAADRAAEDGRRRELVDRLRAAVARIPDVEVVGDQADRLPHVATFSFLYVDGEALVTELDRAGFAVGSGSACTSSTLEPSHVLAAMGVLTHGNVRVALDRSTTVDDVDRFAATLPGAVARVRDALGVGGL
ncbi:aminotransferase class V-fold PLP-dependent enzyme [Isoptericola sp. NEAU-Y5]|uniref:Aminotransferase class V-fold PLP-dependent enzyme n=1 Tax=Isoptericola luteus TaxID=2879484 RepID=A0ABS7ZJR2_9MICO|nr:aminotransferase class V-fold PLP-dependent enzyme [Isoptericola sp. NEAU-Y5]MCA5895259.1 aminotransferase class V-fold PLP-dependent enzyme [Isoptericola sp. NEAU-Y5]